jgi:hypothetical protein
MVFGKRLPGATYILWVEEKMPRELQLLCAEFRKRLEIGLQFNILKFHTDTAKISFLAYPGFFSEPHPNKFPVNVPNGLRHAAARLLKVTPGTLESSWLGDPSDGVLLLEVKEPGELSLPSPL